MSSRLPAEAIGCFLLFATVLGSGIMPEQLADGNAAHLAAKVLLSAG